jgi:hypothetical protein
MVASSFNVDEETHLLGNPRRDESASSSSPLHYNSVQRRVADFVGGLVVASLAFWMFNTPTTSQQLQDVTSHLGLQTTADINRYTYIQPYKSKATREHVKSKYKKFQGKKSLAAF